MFNKEENKLVDSQEKYNLTTEKIECGHCKTNVFMRIICQGTESVPYTWLFDNDPVHGEIYNTDYDYYTWKVLKCLSCSKVNVLQRFSSGEWEAFEERIDFLYPSPDPHKDKPLELKISNEVIEQAIADVEASIHENRTISGVDRIHTALHSYFRLVCINEDISYNKNDDIYKLFKLLHNNHPKLQSATNQLYINEFLNSVANMLNKLNPIRNHTSLAHANESLLEKDEALFYINVVRLLIRYLDKKLMS